MTREQPARSVVCFGVGIAALALTAALPPLAADVGDPATALDAMMARESAEPGRGHGGRAFAHAEAQRALNEVPTAAAPGFSAHDSVAIRAELDPDTLMLSYRLGAARSYLWALTSGGIESHLLPGSERLEMIARRAAYSMSRSHWQLGRDQWLRHAEEASQTLLGPVSHLLERRRLVIVADGALHGISFAALPRPNDPASTPLLYSHEIVYLPSASTLVGLRARQPRQDELPTDGIAVFADPVFERDDPRFRAGAARPLEGNATERAQLRSGPRLTRLTGSLYEAQSIAALGLGTSHLATGFDVTPKAVRHAATRYRILHFATHANAELTGPERSGVVLSMFDRRGEPVDGVLHHHEIPSLDLAADLVVLSGCQTGVSPAGIAAEELGLATGFLRAGAAQVVASLWDVDDRATAELMVAFYRAMFAGRSPAEALRVAQIEFVEGGQWQAPFYWAGFTLVGDWR